MRHIAANYIFDGNNLIKNSYISINDNNQITYIGKENELTFEKSKMLFVNGIIYPSVIAPYYINKNNLYNDEYIYIYQQDIKYTSNNCERQAFENGINALVKMEITDNNSSNIILLNSLSKNFVQIKEQSNIYYALCPSLLEQPLPQVIHELILQNFDKVFLLSFISKDQHYDINIFDELINFSNLYNFKLINLLRMISQNTANALHINLYNNLLLNKDIGLIIIENIDLINLKLNKDTKIKRLF